MVVDYYCQARLILATDGQRLAAFYNNKKNKTEFTKTWLQPAW